MSEGQTPDKRILHGRWMHLVLDALQRDKERNQPLAGASDSDNEDAAEDRIKRSLEKLKRLVHVSHCLRSGLSEFQAEHQRSNALNAKLDKDFHALDEQEQAFVMSVLKNETMMRKTSEAIQELLAPAPEVSVEAAQSMGVLAIHHVKVHTARLLWAERICPQLREIRDLRKRYHDLQDDFKAARSDYLKEVSLLREQVRQRVNPEATIENPPELVDFYEPTMMLDPQELEFLSRVLTEKLKTIFTVNPNVQSACNMASMENMMERVRNNEVEELKAALARKVERVKDLEKELAAAGSKGSAKSEHNGSAKSEHKVDGGKQEMDMVSMLQRQVEELRAELWQERCSLKKEKCRHDAKHEDLQLLQKALDDETAELMAAQRQAAVLREDLASAKALLKAKEEQATSMEAKLEESRREVKRLRSDTQRHLNVLQRRAARESTNDSNPDSTSGRVYAGLSREGSFNPPEVDREPDFGMVGQKLTQREATEPIHQVVDSGNQELLESLLIAERHAQEDLNRARQLSKDCDRLREERDKLLRLLREQHLEQVLCGAEVALEEADSAAALSADLEEGYNAPLGALVKGSKRQSLEAHSIAVEDELRLADADLKALQDELRQEVCTQRSHQQSSLPSEAVGANSMGRLEKLRLDVQRRVFEKSSLETKAALVRWRLAEDRLQGTQIDGGSKVGVTTEAIQLHSTMFKHCSGLARKLKDTATENVHLCGVFTQLGELFQQISDDVSGAEASGLHESEWNSALKTKLQKCIALSSETEFDHLYNGNAEHWGRHNARRKSHRMESLQKIFPAIKLDASKDAEDLHTSTLVFGLNNKELVVNKADAAPGSAAGSRGSSREPGRRRGSAREPVNRGGSKGPPRRSLQESRHKELDQAVHGVSFESGCFVQEHEDSILRHISIDTRRSLHDIPPLLGPDEEFQAQVSASSNESAEWDSEDSRLCMPDPEWHIHLNDCQSHSLQEPSESQEDRQSLQSLLISRPASCPNEDSPNPLTQRSAAAKTRKATSTSPGASKRLSQTDRDTPPLSFSIGLSSKTNRSETGAGLFTHECSDTSRKRHTESPGTSPGPLTRGISNSKSHQNQAESRGISPAPLVCSISDHKKHQSQTESPGTFPVPPMRGLSDRRKRSSHAESSGISPGPLTRGNSEGKRQSQTESLRASSHPPLIADNQDRKDQIDISCTSLGPFICGNGQAEIPLASPGPLKCETRDSNRNERQMRPGESPGSSPSPLQGRVSDSKRHQSQVAESPCNSLANVQKRHTTAGKVEQTAAKPLWASEGASPATIRRVTVPEEEHVVGKQSNEKLRAPMCGEDIKTNGNHIASPLMGQDSCSKVPSVPKGPKPSFPGNVRSSLMERPVIGDFQVTGLPCDAVQSKGEVTKILPAVAVCTGPCSGDTSQDGRRSTRRSASPGSPGGRTTTASEARTTRNTRPQGDLEDPSNYGPVDEVMVELPSISSRRSGSRPHRKNQRTS